MKKYHKQIIFLLCLISGCELIFSQEKYTLSVDELFRKGIENSLSIQSSEIDLELSEDQKAITQKKQLPDIQLSGVFGYAGQSTILDKDLSVSGHPKSPDWKQNYQISVSQPIYQGGGIYHTIKRSELKQQAARLTLSQNKSDLKLWLMSKYLDLYNLYKQYDTYTINIREAEARLKNIKKMKEEGMITSNDVLRSQIQLNDYELLLKEVDNNICLVSQQLTIALGMNEEIIYKPDTTLLSFRSKVDRELNEYIQSAYLNYPNMQIARTNIELAKNSYKITQADYLPHLNLQIGNTFQRPIPNTSPIKDLYINSWGVSLNLSYKISSLFDRKHTLSASKRRINLQELAAEQQKQTIRTNVKAYYLKHQEALNRVEVLKRSVKQANENYRIVNKKYFNQLAILTDLLDANAVQLTAELQLTAAKTNALYTYFQLMNICGKL